MKGPRYTHRRTVLKSFTAAVIGGGALTGTATAAPGKARGRRNEVKIVAKHDEGAADEHFFEMETSEIEAGWTTLEFENPTDETHFAYLPKLPEQAITDAEDAEMSPLEFYIETVTRPFQYFWDSNVPGKTPDSDDQSSYYDSIFPPWFDIPDSLPFYGGAGLTSPGRTSRTTVHLDPGKYIVECYVKDEENDFHSYRGMIDLLTVTDEESQAPEPEATLELSLSNTGIHGLNHVRPGQHTIAVEVEEQQPYANLVGHDIHLVRLDDETDTDDVNGWMNWADPEQFISDGDEPGVFLGGVQDIWTQDLPQTGYFHVNLKPGDYALIAEVPDPTNKGFLEKFSIP